MPAESYWSSLFDVPRIIDWLGLESIVDPIVEIGCGYGTFTVPVARRTAQPVHAFDIEPAMIESAGANVEGAGLKNVTFHCRDVLDAGTGLPSESAGLVLLFNILHSPERALIIKEACRVLKPSGRAAIIHWRKDVATPRGPSIASRPDLPMIVSAISGLGLSVHGEERILPPYHWGIQLTKE